jgi:hypothetical protein
MTKWKLLNWLLEKEEPMKKTETTNSLSPTSNKEKKEPTDYAPTKEYTETLYTSKSVVKQPGRSTEKQHPFPRTSWENPATIERNVDAIDPNQNQTTTRAEEKNSQLEKKVDGILEKKKNQL